MASTAGKFEDGCEQLASEFEEDNGKMNMFSRLKKMTNLKVKWNCHKDEAMKGLHILFVSLVQIKQQLNVLVVTHKLPLNECV